MKPLVVVNFKVYKSAIGSSALRLAKECEKFSKNNNIKVIICVNAVDLKEIASRVKIDVYSQHMDPNSLGKFTGSLPAELIKKSGAKGVLLNHSEKRMKKKELEVAIIQAKKKGLKTIVCAKDDTEAADIAKLRPNYIAIEPPELIGGKISVSTAKPELIEKSIMKVSKYCKLLVGAGIHQNKDVRIALKHGAKGVLISSAITTATRPYIALKKIIIPFK